VKGVVVFTRSEVGKRIFSFIVDIVIFPETLLPLFRLVSGY
jgi:hypothetical protein